MKKASNILLFDLDGTLTKPRGAIDQHVVNILLDVLTKTDWRIGIVTGSNLDYVLEQLGEWASCLAAAGLELYPCNGTLPVEISGDKWVSGPAREIRFVIGTDVYLKVITMLHEEQIRIMKENPDIPLTGCFVDYRQTTINWCPIGRSAKALDRQYWEKIDSERLIRPVTLEKIKEKLEEIAPKRLTAVLGGETSFDIYPVGWDKTYVLNVVNAENIWFVGDRCRGFGNDRALYDALQPKRRSFETTGPEETILIIQNILHLNQ